ncbi:MAG: 50S ribosomal protein L1 [Gammaproteobacteria bacterium]|nr:50S ribosomal protein L1 [Gammaproteobacteria bacterium]
MKNRRMTEARAKIDALQLYPVDKAVELVRTASGTVKFEESIDVSINLGVDPKQSDQNVRGAMVLPQGTGKRTRVAVFAQGDLAQAATDVGADVVGLEDLAERIKGGDLDFSAVIATPDSMPVVGALGQILGPRGLMPNPKTGTVTPDVATAVKNAKAGQVRYRTDKGGIVHCSIGRAGFETAALAENLRALIAELIRTKPASSKGVYIKRITVSPTMGPGVRVDPATV